MYDYAIRIENVSKIFKLYHDPVTGPLKELVYFWNPSAHYTTFQAVKDVSVQIRRGEVVGIVGANGAGKTTLLKMIAGLLPIDQGEINVNGKVTALLAQGVGFHPEFTGRENIIYGGMLLGMSKKEIQSKVDDIIAFSELKDYIDRPLRTYSSGMKARLIFATSMAIKPDILIVDEALATGDSAFVAKSSQRIRDLCQSGATILFVSHNLKQIEDLCGRCIVMDRGSIVFDGSPVDGIAEYARRVRLSRQESSSSAWSALSEKYLRNLRGTGEILIEDTYFVSEGRRTRDLTVGKDCELHIEYIAQKDLPKVKMCIEVRSEKSAITYAYLPPIDTLIGASSAQNLFSLKQGQGKIIMKIPKLPLGDGHYHLDMELYPGTKDYYFSYDTCYCYYARRLDFSVFYEQTSAINKGTICEIPIETITINA